MSLKHFLAKAWPWSPLQSRGRTKLPKTVPFDARKELVSGACVVDFAGLGQLNTGQIYFAQVNFDLVRQLSTVRCPAQTAPCRTADTALDLALAPCPDTASTRIRSSTLHQPRSILCHRLCRAPIGDVPGSDPTARPLRVHSPGISRFSFFWADATFDFH